MRAGGARFRPGAVVVGTWLMLAGCDGGPMPAATETVTGVTAAILGGAPDTTDGAVVAVTTGDGQARLHLCSGTIVRVLGRSALVLTAAHCVVQLDSADDVKTPVVVLAPQAVTVSTGGLALADRLLGRTFGAAAIAVHPDYDGFLGSVNDVAVIRIVGATDRLPVMPLLAAADDHLQPGSAVTLVGFGDTERPDSAILRRATPHTVAWLNARLLGFDQTGGRGFCHGDSGGPVLVVSGSAPAVAAVASFVHGPPENDCAGGSTSIRVQPHADFVARAAAQTPPALDCAGCLRAEIAPGNACGPQMACGGDCVTYEKCVEACADEACLEACLQGPGADLYIAHLQRNHACADQRCAAVCAAEPAHPSGGGCALSPRRPSADGGWCETIGLLMATIICGALSRRRARLRRAALAATLALALVAPVAAHAAPVRLALLVGQDVGAADDVRLAYAERDAQRMYDVLTSLGDVSRDRAYLLTDASAQRVREVLGELRGRAAELEKIGDDPILFVYVSGHADAAGLRLGASRLSHEDLRSLVDAVPGRVKILIVDACASGAVIRPKGGRTVAPFKIDLEQDAQVSGRVILTSTGAGEPAQEWEALGGALFTHHLLAALRGAGDRDGDGRITLSEAYAYTYGRTLSASTGASAGPQHPAQEIELRGTGELVITRPGALHEGLLLGPAASGHYVVSAAFGGELALAVDKAPGHPMRLALTPGRYVVRKPEGRFVRVAEVIVQPGSTVPLDEARMDQVPYAEVARRGPGPVLTRAVELGYSAGAPWLDGEGIVQRLGLALRRERGALEIAAGIDGGRGALANQELTVHQWELLGYVDGRWRFPVGVWLPYLGVRGGAGWIHQTLERDQEQTIQSVFGQGRLPARDGMVAVALLTAGAEVPLAPRLLARIEAFGGAVAPHLAGGWTARPHGGGRLAVGWRW